LDGQSLIQEIDVAYIHDEIIHNVQREGMSTPHDP